MDVSEKVVESEHKDQGNMSTKPGEMNVQHKTRTFQQAINKVKNINRVSRPDSVESYTELFNIIKKFVMDSKLSQHDMHDKIYKGVAGLIALWFIFGHGVHLLQLAVGVLYPTYKSIQALENPTEDRGNVSQWLTYWVVYSIFSMVEFFLDIVISWLPLYSMSKVLFLAWLVAPIFPSGAELLYNKVVFPFFKKHQHEFDRYADDAGKLVSMAVDSVKDAAAEQQLRKS